MELYERFRNFLGFSPRRESPQPNISQRDWPSQEPSRHEFGAPFQDDSTFGFNMFTNPFEIHKYFEQQMGEMLKNFGFNHFGDGFSDQFSIEGPQGEDRDLPSSGNLRDHFLKPGYERALDDGSHEKRDEDIDGKLDIKDWGSVLKGEHAGAPKTHFYGRSMTSKSIRNPDGSVEIHRTVKDNEGNEETTVTRRVGDKEYSIVKKRDKHGKEETIENLVNLEENEVSKFFPKL